jgi:hypothetical protein
MSHTIAQALREQLKDCQFDFGDTPADSVMEFLYIAYSEISRSDPKEITEGFATLEQFFEGRVAEESTEMFSIICNICFTYEQRPIGVRQPSH